MLLKLAAMDVPWDDLYEAARAARLRAYAPYSHFQVGAALRTVDGRVFTGCNVENRTFGLTICAERVAVARAVEAGVSTFEALAVVTDTSPAAMPCGMCLETLSEFAEDMPILIANLAGERRMVTLRQIHPDPFRWPAELATEVGSR